MATIVVSKKVSLVGSWSEDVVTDEILNEIATRAKTEKGKKMKVKVNEVGIRLSRIRFLQESLFKFFPIKCLQTVMQSPDFPKCVMFILSDQDKKYKIIAVRCESELDAVILTSNFADIQNKVQSTNIELRKRENGNWTLRGRTDHNANRQLLEIFNEHKQSNGEMVVTQANGAVTHVPVLDASETRRNGSHHERVYIKRNKDTTKDKIANIKESSDDDDDYIIETEVTTRSDVLAQAAHSHVSAQAAHSHVSAQAAHSHVSAQAAHSHVSAQAAHPYVSTQVHTDNDNNGVKDVTTRLEHADINDHHAGVWISGKPSRFSEASTLPSRPIVYRASSKSVGPSQPVVYSTSWNSNEPTITATSPVYYTNPWAQRRMSRESSLVPMRIDGHGGSIVKFDQQSLMSNTSRLSRFSKMRSSEMSIPTTVQRSIEYVYPRQVVMLRRPPTIVGYRQRPHSYHAVRNSDLQSYYEGDAGAGMRL